MKLLLLHTVDYKVILHFTITVVVRLHFFSERVINNWNQLEQTIVEGHI